MDDSYYMDQALALAAQAAAEGEVPVGCVIVCRDEIVGTGRNRREKDKNALAHAEIEAINEACRKLGGWRLFLLPQAEGQALAEHCGAQALWVDAGGEEFMTPGFRERIR